MKKIEVRSSLLKCRLLVEVDDSEVDGLNGAYIAGENELRRIEDIIIERGLVQGFIDSLDSLRIDDGDYCRSMLDILAKDNDFSFDQDFELKVMMKDFYASHISAGRSAVVSSKSADAILIDGSNIGLLSFEKKHNGYCLINKCQGREVDRLFFNFRNNKVYRNRLPIGVLKIN